MLITRRHGSWVVLGTLVTDVELEPTPPLDAGCGRCTLCIDACPTGRSTSRACSTRPAASRTGRRRAGAIPDDVMDALGDRVYGCDICQDVCPWNRGVEKRRAGAAAPDGAEPVVSLVDWLERDGAGAHRRARPALRPENDPRWLRRNALVALGNVGGSEDARAGASRFVDDDDPVLRRAAAAGRGAHRGRA